MSIIFITFVVGFRGKTAVFKEQELKTAEFQPATIGFFQTGKFAYSGKKQ